MDSDERRVPRIEANLYKLVNVIRVENITPQPSVFRDLAMIKVAATRRRRVARSCSWSTSFVPASSTSRPSR